eukprot:TRINITY_DN10252_c0_g1_i1.p1 TRINITY_DN10252_c0_g1~~TRINITY_DN10252_c0_g1_i1.p1  ORF type:complete len:452 (-),score=72.61 TRINITY_DN10252_c0_g1_i1:155-1510(-)
MGICLVTELVVMEPPSNHQHIAGESIGAEAASLLDWLPPELLLQSLSFADLRDLSRISRVCRALHSLASQDSLWRAMAERIVGWHHEKIMKPAARSWKEQCRRFVTPPAHVDLELIPDDDLVVCGVRIGDFFYEQHGYVPVGKYTAPVCRKSDSVKESVPFRDVFRNCAGIGNFVGSGERGPGDTRKSTVTLMDGDFNVVGHIDDALTTTVKAFGDNFVRWRPRRLKLELVTLDGHVLNTYTLPVKIQKYADGAATSERFGFMVGPFGDWLPELTPGDLLLFNRDLELVDTMRVINDRIDYCQPTIYSVADRLVVVLIRSLDDRAPSDDTDTDSVTSFTMFLVSSRTRKTFEMPATDPGDVVVLAYTGRLFVSTPGPRVYCFSADAALLWVHTVAVPAGADIGLDWEIFCDATYLYLLWTSASPERQDARVLRLSYDQPSRAQAQGLLADG